MKLLSFGEILWDVYPEKSCIGGAPFNFAAHFVKQGGEAYMLSAVGEDELGRAALESLKRLGIGTDYMSVSEKETGKCLVELDSRGIPSYNLLNSVAYDDISCGAISEDIKLLYFGTLALRDEHNVKTLLNLADSHSFDEIFADVNIRKPFISREAIMLCLNRATIIKISDEELPFFSSEAFGCECDCDTAADKIFANHPNIRLVIITKGAEGSVAYDRLSGKRFESKAVKTEVVSTVGAGDSFSAAFLYKYISGLDIERCLKFASLVSAFVVSKTEAVPEYNPKDLQGAELI